MSIDTFFGLQIIRAHSGPEAERDHILGDSVETGVMTSSTDARGRLLSVSRDPNNLKGVYDQMRRRNFCVASLIVLLLLGSAIIGTAKEISFLTIGYSGELTKYLQDEVIPMFRRMHNGRHPVER